LLHRKGSLRHYTGGGKPLSDRRKWRRRKNRKRAEARQRKKLEIPPLFLRKAFQLKYEKGDREGMRTIPKKVEDD